MATNSRSLLWARNKQIHHPGKSQRPALQLFAVLWALSRASLWECLSQNLGWKCPSGGGPSRAKEVLIALIALSVVPSWSSNKVLGWMFYFSLPFNSYKKSSSCYPHSTDEGSGRKERALSKITSQWVEGVALEPRATSCMSVTVPSAVLPKPSPRWVPESENQYSCYLHSCCPKCYAQRYSVRLCFCF